MNDTEISIQERTKKFAVRVIKAYVQLCKISNYDDAARVLAKQFLKSGTSIGANCPKGYRLAYAGAKSAQSTKDFIHKYEIALKEAQEFKYWVEIMIEAEIVPASKFTLLLQEITSIINILAATIKTLKKKNS